MAQRHANNISATVLCLSSLCLGQSAFGTQVDEREHVLRWAQANHQLARAGKLPSPLKVVIRRQFLPGADDALLAHWRKEVEGKPEHPLRREIRSEELKRRQGHFTQIDTLWRLDQDRWRVSKDYDYLPESKYFDTSRNQGTAWQLDERTLSLFDEGSPSDSSQACDNNLTGVLSTLLTFYSWGFDDCDHVTEPDFRVVSGGNTWSVELSSSQGWRWRWLARVQSERVYASRLDLFKPNEPIPHKTTTFEVVGADAGGDSLWPPVRQVLIETPTIAARSRIRIEELRPTSEDEVQPLLQAPDPLGSDPIRGTLTVKRVDDNRAGKYRSHVPGSDVFIPLHTPRSDGETGTLRIIGWSALVLLALSFVALKLTRRS